MYKNEHPYLSSDAWTEIDCALTQPSKNVAYLHTWHPTFIFSSQVHLNLAQPDGEISENTHLLLGMFRLILLRVDGNILIR